MRKKKAKVYIDGANMFYTQKKLGWSFDWKKIKKLIEEKHDVIEWRYYVGVKEEDEKMKHYLTYLDECGFTLFIKPLKKIKIERSDIRAALHESLYIYKANFDVEIAVDILTDKTALEGVILFSGDSDFAYLIKRIKSIGRLVIIYSSRKTLAWELKLETPHLVYLEDIKAKIRRQ